MAKAKTQRHTRRVTYHAWAWKAGRTWPEPGELFWWAETKKPQSRLRPSETGKWVRITFVEVE